MEPLNFCRNMTRQFNELMSKKIFDKKVSNDMALAIDKSKNCEKFYLPEGGRLLDDLSLRGLDDVMVLRLPYKQVALEYTRINALEKIKNDQTQVPSSRTIIFATELGDFIEVQPVVYFDQQQLWFPMPSCGINVVDFIEKRGDVAEIKFSNVGNFPDSDYQDELSSLLSFLSAMQCSNVSTEKISSRNGKQPKKALPFDEYHILKVDTNKDSKSSESTGTGRSPREHLRRGHIRRLKDKKIWINSTVVCANRGYGVITKDYEVV